MRMELLIPQKHRKYAVGSDFKKLLQNAKWLNWFCRDALEDLDNLMEQMKNNNTRDAGLVIGKAIGILQIQDNTTETKDICYASDTKIISVRPEKV